jgi:hypothetical protein
MRHSHDRPSDDVPTQHGNFYQAQNKDAHNVSTHSTIEGEPKFAWTFPRTMMLGSAETQSDKRYILPLIDIVLPTLQEGHKILLIAAGWKFFPLHELRGRKIDLETQVQGWQLRLGPLSSEVLNIRAHFVVNGCQNPGDAFAADSV